MWGWIGMAGLLVLLVGTLWLVRRADHGVDPYVDPYDWQ